MQPTWQPDAGHFKAGCQKGKLSGYVILDDIIEKAFSSKAVQTKAVETAHSLGLPAPKRPTSLKILQRRRHPHLLQTHPACLTSQKWIILEESGY